MSVSSEMICGRIHSGASSSQSTSQVNSYANDKMFPEDFEAKLTSDYLSGDCNQFIQETKSEEELHVDLLSPENENESSDSLSSSVSMSDSGDSLGNISDSESITDVTPLHSPYCDSPLPKGKVDSKNIYMDVEPHRLSAEKESNLKRPMGYPVSKDPSKVPPLVRKSVIENKSLDMNELLEAVKQLESNQGPRNVRPRNCVTPPITRRRKGIVSFSNDDVYKMDQENQRLLKKLVSLHARTKSKYLAQARSRPTSSVLSRRRSQQSIEFENQVS